MLLSLLPNIVVGFIVSFGVRKLGKTLRKFVDELIVIWEGQHSKGEQTQSLELYVATKVRENLLSSYVPDIKKFLELSPEIRSEILEKYTTKEG